ncbi:MAG: EAL domain-containing protein [Rhodobacteraceae bacterium]|nr:EAL domain-containing protein [Paracoccaceae bacterium]
MSVYDQLGDSLDSPLDYVLSQRSASVHQMVREAIRRRDVVLAFQPVVYTRRPLTVAFYEGLIRLLDDKRRVIPAREFMGVAETSEIGRIIDCLSLELGLVALREEPSLRLSINMSARSIGYPRWTETLHRGLAHDPDIGERLILEITEASAMLMPDIVAVFMADLHKRGITFALDDFGAGYTAFRYLRDFYFDIVKIDGQFVRGISGNAGNQVVLQAMVGLARQFDMFTVAEAVETAEEAAFLAEIGVECVQGYHFGAPALTPPWKEDADPVLLRPRPAGGAPGGG